MAVYSLLGLSLKLIVAGNLLTLGSQSTASANKSKENFDTKVDVCSPPSGERLGSYFKGSGAG
jgi:hypothetical protein